MQELIDPIHTEDPARVFGDYDQAKPFRHLVLDDFFEPRFADALLKSFPAFDTTRAMNENGEIGAKCVHQDLRKLAAPYQELDQYIQSRGFLGWLETLTGIDELIYDPDYFGGGTHENRHGQDLDPHVDFNRHPKTGLHRRLNLIVYLNETWNEDWGGAIEFHQDPRLPPAQNEIKYVQPRFNRAVLFETTHWSWHGFQRINLPEGDSDPRSRKSVALYFYSRTRPEEERTKPHSTIYVERPLPDDIRPGVALTEERYQQIRGMLERRDRHLKRLYDNISNLSAHVEDLIAQRDRAMQMAGRAGSPDKPSTLTRARRWLARKIAD